MNATRCAHIASTTLLQAIAIAIALLTVSSARAHGGPPIVEGVLAVDGDGPWLVKLSEGFALRSADGDWSFVCPALFGADVPPVNATVAGQVSVAGSMDLHRLSAEPSVHALNRPDLSGTRVLALAALDDALLALRLAPSGDGGGSSGTELVRFRDDVLDTFSKTRVLQRSGSCRPHSTPASAALVAGSRIVGSRSWLVLGGDELSGTRDRVAGGGVSIRLASRRHCSACLNGGYTLLQSQHAASPLRAQVSCNRCRARPALRGAESCSRAMRPGVGPGSLA